MGRKRIYCLPFLFVFIKSPSTEKQNSIRTGSFLLSVCCFFSLLLRLPSVACFR
ncbi:hypothetical protein EVA_18769 [gut metagenome]|uniref:Uncharacterized protein n=1 Tax=gut metagenome TaxID=749906 RepID=J9FU81_9ZZZZ